MAEEEEQTYKVTLIGQSGVGKTCIIAQFINNSFDPDTISSASAQFLRKVITFEDDKRITFDIWDTAGQEKYRAMAKVFYKDATAVILVYDITNKTSFEEMKNYWYPQVKENGQKDVIYAVAANKSDLYEQQKVSDEEGEEFAKSIGAIYASTSAKNDSGIKVLFENIALKIFDPNFNFAENEEKKKKEYQEKKLREAKNNQMGSNNTIKNNQGLQPTPSMRLKKPSKDDKIAKKKKCC